MSDFLLIHTSLDEGFVALSRNGVVIASITNDEPREHGAILHDAIDRIREEQHISFSELSAIGVTGGPGSYTGIRVGLSAAKGIAYAIDKPVVVCSNLAVLAHQKQQEVGQSDLVYIPLIHARKDEYYAGFYGENLVQKQPDSIVLLHEDINRAGVAAKRLYFGINIATEAFEGHEDLLDQEKLTISPDGLNAVVNKRYDEGLAVAADDANALYLKDAYITKSDKLHI